MHRRKTISLRNTLPGGVPHRGVTESRRLVEQDSAASALPASIDYITRYTSDSTHNLSNGRSTLSASEHKAIADSGIDSPAKSQPSNQRKVRPTTIGSPRIRRRVRSADSSGVRRPLRLSGRGDLFNWGESPTSTLPPVEEKPLLGGDGGDGPPMSPEANKLSGVEYIEPSAELLAAQEMLREDGIDVEAPRLPHDPQWIQENRANRFGSTEVARWHDVIKSDIFSSENMEDRKKAISRALGIDDPEILAGFAHYDICGTHDMQHGRGPNLEALGICAGLPNPDFVDGESSKDLDDESYNSPYFSEPNFIFSKFERENGELVPARNGSGQIIQGTVLDTCCGSGDFAVRCKKIMDVLRFINRQRATLTEKGSRPTHASIKEILAIHSQNVMANFQRAPINPRIIALDGGQGFIDRLRNSRHVNALWGNIAGETSKVFNYGKEMGLPRKYDIKPNGVDFIHSAFAWDRVDDFEQNLDNERYCSRPDGSTRFVHIGLVPFDPFGDVISKSDTVQQLRFWDPEGDFRSAFMEGVDIDDRLEELADEEGLECANRAQIIYNMVKAYKERGHDVRNIAQHPYEVYCPHCVIETCEVLRNDPKYEFLETMDFGDPSINASVREMLTNTDKYPDDLRFGIPQRYKKENVLIMGGTIVPLDFSEYAETLDDADSFPPPSDEGVLVDDLDYLFEEPPEDED